MDNLVGKCNLLFLFKSAADSPRNPLSRCRTAVGVCPRRQECRAGIKLKKIRVRRMTGDVEKMIAVGLVWGATNALMRRGALIWDEAVKSTSPPPYPLKIHQKLFTALKNWLKLLIIWQYSVPFLLNLSASVTFFVILSNTPISLAVPVTNATTFAATALFGMLLGEKTRVGLSLLGTSFIVLGVWLCINA